MTILASTTLAGAGAASIVADALLSVIEHVDIAILIDTGTEPETILTARATAGEKLRVVRWRWRDDFASARNAALEIAAAYGATHALTVDTDERIAWNGEDLHACIDGQEACLSAFDAGGFYTKPRALRTDTEVRWVGVTHEAFPAHLDARGQAVLPHLRFAELAKTPAQLRVKFARDSALLHAHVQRDPLDARSWYYLGDALAGLAETEHALAAFRACAALRGWDEESAWACYRAAELLLGLGRYDETLDACAAGLARHAGVAELAWLAGLASLRAGRPAQAIYWSRLAEVHGADGDGMALARRIGFREPRGLGPGPAEALRAALATL